MNTLTETRHTKNISLRDGTDLTIRFIRPEDAFGLQRLLSRLAPETVYFRFLSFRSYLPDAETLHLATVDYQNRVAFVATRWVEGGEEIVGVARYDVLGKTAPGAA
jgi:acetyltransferase